MAILANRSLEDLARSAIRRSYVFVFIPVLVLFVVTALGESDKLLHALDDEIIVVVSLGILLYLLATRKASSPAELLRINRVAVVAALVVALAGVLAVAFEFSDPNDLGDDPLTIVGGVLAAINGLWLLAAKAGPGAGVETAAFATEWSRIRTTFFYSAFFVALFATGFVPPYPSFNGAGLLFWVELAVVLVVAVAGLVFLARSRTEPSPAVVRKYNNTYLALVVVLGVVAVAQFDILTLIYVIVLVANRFL